MPSEANSRVLFGFLDYLKIEKGLAPLTIVAYTTDIGQFAAFLEKHKRTLLNAQRKNVREFIQQMFANSVDGRSVGRKLSALRHLYRYLSARQGYRARSDTEYRLTETMEGVAQGSGPR